MPDAGRAIAIIPARAAARRLPDKPLQLLGGVPLINRVRRAVVDSGCFEHVLVACDDVRVEAVVRADGGRAVRIDQPCGSGTERVALAAVGHEVDYVVNVQGDEPFVTAAALRALLGALGTGAPIATLATQLLPEHRHDPSVVKVVSDRDGRALYFSRAPIPGDRHLGLYGFRAEALQRVAYLRRGPLSIAEDLEQLAWLEAGWPIAVAPSAPLGPSIDTPEDLIAAEAWLERSA